MKLKPCMEFTSNYEDNVIVFGAQLVFVENWYVFQIFFFWWDFTIGFKWVDSYLEGD